MTCRTCDRPAKCKGFCLNCYSKEKYRGHTSPVESWPLCISCGFHKPHCAKNQCRNCYNYWGNTGRFRGRDDKWHRVPGGHKRFCIVCLSSFPAYRRQMCCSTECAGIRQRMRTFRGRFATCQRCNRVRLIRCKKLCGSCYAMVRLEMQAMGLGHCPLRLSRVRQRVGYL
jgi:hypothetical protein